MTYWNSILEAAIIGKLVTSLVDEGFQIHIEHNGDTFIYAIESGSKNDHSQYWVRLVLGNGADVIVDYSTNLEKIIKPANDLAAQFDN